MNEYETFVKELLEFENNDPLSMALVLEIWSDGNVDLDEETLKKVKEVALDWYDSEKIDKLFNKRETKKEGEDEEEGNWKDFEPYVKKDDEGEFVLQEHERGLTEEQAKSGRRFEGKENIHCDLRLKFKDNDFLIGFTLATPGTAHGINKIVEPDKGKALLVGVKKRQPIAWLDVGKGKDMFKSGAVEMNLYGNKYKADLSSSGQVGSTAYTWSRFTAIDYGKVKAGKQDKHYKEFFFDGKYGILKGRWIVQGVPSENMKEKGAEIDKRIWFFSKGGDNGTDTNGQDNK